MFLSNSNQASQKFLMDLNSESLFSSIQMQILLKVLVFRKEQNLSNYRFEFLIFKKKKKIIIYTHFYIGVLYGTLSSCKKYIYIFSLETTILCLLKIKFN